jgi:hypothetical protein
MGDCTDLLEGVLVLGRLSQIKRVVLDSILELFETQTAQRLQQHNQRSSYGQLTCIFLAHCGIVFYTENVNLPLRQREV